MLRLLVVSLRLWTRRLPEHYLDGWLALAAIDAAIAEEEDLRGRSTCG